MSVRSFSSVLAVLLSSAALSACLTPHVRPAPSRAVVQARANRDIKPAPCTPSDVSTVSPVMVGFGFDEAVVGEAANDRLRVAARWLVCNPGVETVILPTADGRGDKAHLDDLASHRAQATVDALRTLGATNAVLHIVPRGGEDPVKTPHLVIQASGRGW